MSRAVLIVGFGNALAGDDGAGLEACAELALRALPPGARVEFGGTDALCLAGLWRGEDEVFLVDAVEAGDAPGAIHRFDHAALLGVQQASTDAHHLSLADCLRLLPLVRPEMARVRYRLWGIEPAAVVARDGVSPEVAAAARRVADEVVRAARELAAAPASAR